jgi:hypothetical protein
MKRTHGERKQSNRMGSESMKNDSEWLGKEEKRKRQTYEVMLSQCGSESIISMDGPGWKGAFKISIPYDKLKEYFPWQYMEGKGLVIRFTEEGLNDFITVLEWLKEDCEGEKGGGSAHRGYEAEAA